MRMPPVRRLRVCPLTAGLALMAALPALAAEPAGIDAAGPTVVELLAACERGRAAGDVGVDAALCEWYAVPCDCSGKVVDAGPRWCMPDDESIDAALPKVLAALRAEPRRQAPAADVVPEIMARLYPCAKDARR
jgi:hypothetical protein